MSRNAEIKSSVAPLQRRFSDKSEEKVRNPFRYNARQTINSRRPAVLISRVKKILSEAGEEAEKRICKVFSLVFSRRRDYTGHRSARFILNSPSTIRRSLRA